MDFNNQNGNQGGQFSYDYSGNGTDYSTPTTGFTGDTANWQANNESVQQAEQPAYTQSTYTAPDYSANQYGNAAPIYNAAPVKNNKGIGLSIAALVCGILSILCCCVLGGLGLIFAIPAVILGIIALNKKAAGKGMAVAGTICGGIGVVLCIVCIVMAVLGFTAGLADLEDYTSGTSYSSDYYDYYY